MTYAHFYGMLFAIIFTEKCINMRRDNFLSENVIF